MVVTYNVMNDVDENAMRNDTKDAVWKVLKAVYDDHKQILALP